MKAYEDGVEAMRQRVQEIIKDWLTNSNATRSEDAMLVLNALAGDVMVATVPVEYPSSGVVHERVDAIATFDSVAQGPSSPQVTPPKYDPSWHGSQAHTFVTDKPVGSEVKPRTGDNSMRRR